MHRIFFFLLSFLVACSADSSKKNSPKGNVAEEKPSPLRKEIFETGKILPKIACTTDPSQSFAFCLPSSYDTSKKFPVIIFFDPHGSGNFVVTKYAPLAEEFNTILIASNDSKNGLTFDQTNQIANTLVNEATHRFSTGQEVILAGFSGGARVAISSAMSNQQVESVIYCGAAMPIQKDTRLFSLLGFAGMYDMNYTDVILFDQSLQNSNYNHFLIEWNGKHEWPDSVTFRDAFYWITFNRMHTHEIPFNPQLAQQFVDENSKKLNTDNGYAETAAVNRKIMGFLSGLADVTKYASALSQAEQNPIYKKEMDQKQHIQQQETELKKQYVDAFQTKDLNWWKAEITRMNAINDIQQKPMYQRLLGFISLAGFSISNNAIQQNKFPLAEKMLAIYKLADPKNSDQPFLEACMFAKQGMNEKAMESLQHAVDLGLNDASRILNEPALSSLLQDEKLKTLLSKMKQS